MTVGPKGRAEVEAALIDATATMCRERSPASVTLRGIAAEAGVNHGQVRHYFGSKTELVAATIEHLEGFMLDRLETNSTEDSAEMLLRSLTEDPAFSHLIGWLLAEEVSPESVGLRFRFGRALIGQMVADGADTDAATTAASQIMVVCAGWTLLRPMLVASNRLDGNAQRELVEALATQVRALAAGPLPGGVPAGPKKPD